MEPPFLSEGGVNSCCSTMRFEVAGVDDDEEEDERPRRLLVLLLLEMDLLRLRLVDRLLSQLEYLFIFNVVFFSFGV